MRVACSASLRVTPLETRACLSVSPKTLIVTIRLPSPRRTNAQGPSIPLFHRIGFTRFGQLIGQALLADPGRLGSATSGVAAAPLSRRGDRGAGSLARETIHPRRRATHRPPAATNLRSPTGTVPGHLR